MFARSQLSRKAAVRLAALVSALWLAACEPVSMSGGGGPSVDPGETIRVALLVPGGSPIESDGFLASNLENAARMAIADLNGVEVDMQVYNTAGSANQAAQVAAQAVNDGAQVILGPLYGEAANAAGVAVSGTGVNVLAFSNNPTIAGGNVFILGPTFANTANRLVRYGTRQGLDSYIVVHGDDVQGNLGRDAIAQAVRANGATLSGIQTYDLTQQSIFSRASAIAAAINGSGADAVFLTGGVNADLPIIATALPENGVSPAVKTYMGLTRWDAAPQALALPGLQGGLFAIPDQGLSAQFESRYQATYGIAPHPLAGLAYDGISAIGALVARGGGNPLSRAALTQGSGFTGTTGVFRFLGDGTNERGLAVATIENQQVVIVDPAPRSFGGAGF